MNKTLIYTIAMFMILGFVSVEGNRFRHAPDCLSGHRRVDTCFGTVFLVPINLQIPWGYRILTMYEGKIIKA
jgi:hypothetical protein